MNFSQNKNNIEKVSNTKVVNQSLPYLYKQWFPLIGGKKGHEHEHGHGHGHGEECKGNFKECGDKEATIQVLLKLDALKPKEEISFADVNVGDIIEVREGASGRGCCLVWAGMVREGTRPSGVPYGW